MDSDPTPWLVEGILGGPVGVALLEQLEGQCRLPPQTVGSLVDSDPGAVERAADSVATMSFGEFVALAVHLGDTHISPWRGDASDNLTSAYRTSATRRPIAEAIAGHFGPQLAARADLGAQQWWHSNTPKEGYFSEARFRDFSKVYDGGQFPWAGLWTVTDPPPEAHHLLVGAWELFPEPASQWHLPVRPGARVWDVASPADWARLVESYPKTAANPNPDWVRSVPYEWDARVRRSAHLVPDWEAVSHDYDGVHLSWAGFMTTEGYLSDLPDGLVTMLRYWFSERTLWLADVFGHPVSGPPLVMPGGVGSGEESLSDERRRSDLEVLNAALGR